MLAYSVISEAVLLVVLTVFLGNAAAVTGQVTVQDYYHHIYVAAETSEDAVANRSCWTGNYSLPCSSLSLALEGAQHFSNSTAVVLRDNGSYPFNGSAFQLEKLSDFALLSNCENMTLAITCNGNGGLTFLNCVRITLQNVVFEECGNYGVPQTTISDTRMLADAPTAIHFSYCEDVYLCSVRLFASRVGGLTLDGVTGTVNINRLFYLYNDIIPIHGNSDVPQTTNGIDQSPVGMYISAVDNTSAKYFIDDSRFDKMDNSSSLSRGLVIVFQAHSKDNHIEIHSSEIKGNVAGNGAGVLTLFQDCSRNNSVVILSTNVESNVAYTNESNNFFGAVQPSGGGVQVVFETGSMNNSFVVHNCSFYNNSAYIGGGIAIKGSLSDTQTDSSNSNSITVENSMFLNNHAVYGAAVDLYGGLDISQEMGIIDFTFTNCTFFSNGIPYGQNFLNSFSIVNILRASVTIYGHVSFEDSRGSPLVIDDSIVRLNNRSTISFTNNTANNGGALAFKGRGHIVVHSGSKLQFVGNTAFEKGGAIYYNEFNEHLNPLSRHCIFESDSPDTHPDSWNTTFYFSTNRAANGENSIFVPSLASCTWTLSDDLPIALNETFCWRGWMYDNSSCSHEVMTAPAYFKDNKVDITMFSGQRTEIPITVYSELNQDVSANAVYMASVVQSAKKVMIIPEYITHNNITVFGVPNSTVKLAIETVGSARTIQAEVTVSILACPPGFEETVSETGDFTCACGGNFGEQVICSNADFSAYMSLGNCMSLDKDTQQPILARCPYYVQYARRGLSIIPLPKNASIFDESICGSINRQGKLCSNCKEGYGISVLSYGFECVKCSDNAVGYWIAFLLAKFGSITLFFALILCFSVRLTSAPANSFIFFSQVISISREILILQAVFALFINNGDTGLSVILIPYSIWNLDFFRTVLPLFCVDHNLRALHLLAFDYAAAFFPLLLILISYICIKQSNWFNLVSWVCTPCTRCLAVVRQKWNLQTNVTVSILHGFVAFLLLSYSKIIVVSLSLLTPTYVRYNDGIFRTQVLWYDGSVDFFHSEHLAYAIPAIIIFTFFSLVPPILLLFYQYAWFQKILQFTRLSSITLNTFVEVFQGCFKDGTRGAPDRRYFAGIYFILRLIIFSLWATVIDIHALLLSLQFTFTIAALMFAILQPYKVDYYNKLDMIVFALLVLLNSSLYYVYSNFLRALSISTPALVTTYTLLVLPVLYISFYALYLIATWRDPCKTWIANLIAKLTHCSIQGSNTTEDEERFELDISQCSLPDRVIRPEDYRDGVQEVSPIVLPAVAQDASVLIPANAASGLIAIAKSKSYDSTRDTSVANSVRLA